MTSPSHGREGHPTLPRAQLERSELLQPSERRWQRGEPGERDVERSELRESRELVGQRGDAEAYDVELLEAMELSDPGRNRLDVVLEPELQRCRLIDVLKCRIEVPQPTVWRYPAAMHRAWLFALLLACGGTQRPTVITTPQDYEQVVVDVVNRVITIFQDGGINCNMISGELRGLTESQKFDAAKTWRKDHPEANDTLKKVISQRKADLDKAMGPASRQCEGPIKGQIAELTE